ncbi:MAG: T9SS type A sorting domain-containing protein, partial [Reichenbachiella sp.]
SAADSLFLSIDQTNFDFNYQFDSILFELNSNITSLNVTSRDNWLQASITNNFLKINVDANSTYEDRESELVIFGEGLSITVSVTQNSLDSIFIQLEEESLELSSKSGSVNIDFLTNDQNIKTSNNVDWVQSEIIDSLLVITYDQNLLEENRVGEVIIFGDNVSTRISISQLAKDSTYIEITPNELTVDHSSGDFYILVNTNLEDYSITNSSYWISLNQDGSLIKIEYLENNIGEDRVGIIQLGHDLDSAQFSLTQTSIPIIPLSSTLYTNGVISLYPNPTLGIINLEVNSSLVKEYGIIDLLGHLITVPINNSQDSIEMDLSNLEAGVYYIKVQMMDQSQILKKIILIK